MLDRPGLRNGLLLLAMLAALSGLQLAILGLGIVKGAPASSAWCVTHGVNLCKASFEIRQYAEFGPISVLGLAMGGQVANFMALACLTVATGIGNRAFARRSMQVAFVATCTLLVGALTWTVVAKRTSLGDATALDCRLIAAMLGVAVVCGVLNLLLMVLGIPDTWPAQEEDPSQLEGPFGLVVAIAIVGATLTGFGLHAKTARMSTDVSAVQRAEQLATYADLPRQPSCEAGIYVRDGVLWQRATSAHLRPEAQASGLMAIRVNWAAPGRAISAVQAWNDEIRMWRAAPRDVVVVNTAATSLCTVGTGDAVRVSPECLHAAASHCVAEHAPDRWLTWFRRPGLADKKAQVDLEKELQDLGAPDAAKCLREEREGGFRKVAAARQLADDFALYLQQQGRCPTQSSRLDCFNGDFGILIRGPEPDPRSDFATRATQDELARSVRQCVRAGLPPDSAEEEN